VGYTRQVRDMPASVPVTYYVVTNYVTISIIVTLSVSNHLQNAFIQPKSLNSCIMYRTSPADPLIHIQR
jgi:hypothetical protein